MLKPLKVATPVAVSTATVSVPFSVPSPAALFEIASVTFCAMPVTVRPAASCSVTAGCVAQATLLGPPPGCVVKASCAGGPTPGFTVNADGSKEILHGHGIGSNYWDLLPFGWDDFYATAQYYASILVMADAEEAVAAHPEWDIPTDGEPFKPKQLRRHAAAVKKNANRVFWNEETGRFVACIDEHGPVVIEEESLFFPSFKKDNG